MSYKDAYHPKVKADLRKLDKPVVMRDPQHSFG